MKFEMIPDGVQTVRNTTHARGAKLTAEGKSLGEAAGDAAGTCGHAALAGALSELGQGVEQAMRPINARVAASIMGAGTVNAAYADGDTEMAGNAAAATRRAGGTVLF